MPEGTGCDRKRGLSENLDGRDGVVVKFMAERPFSVKAVWWIDFTEWSDTAVDQHNKNVGDLVRMS